VENESCYTDNIRCCATTVAVLCVADKVGQLSGQLLGARSYSLWSDLVWSITQQRMLSV